MDRILVVDGDHGGRRMLENMLYDSEYRVTKASSGEMVLELICRSPIDLIIMEARLPGVSGLDTLVNLRTTHPRLPVIIVAETADTEDIIRASKLGAFEYVLKPFDKQELMKLVAMALETGRFMSQPVAIDRSPEETAGDNLIGRSQPMQEIYKAIGRVAPTDATVIIRGDSGTGKELVARALYQHSERVTGPFVIVNCVAIPENLLESELFGYEKGAFTGADRQRIGKIEYADKGTVFLDEIGDIPPSIQAKMLRLLQEKKIERIGGSRPIQADVRIIAATNADLEAKIKDGRFREDLYYRINVVTLNLPPLKNRAEDIPLLADYFMVRFSKNLGVRNPGILPEAKQTLMSYDWPGNVRELANTIEKCLIFSRGRPVGKDEVADLFSGEGNVSLESPQSLDILIRHWVRQNLVNGRANLLDELSDHLAALIISETLDVCHGNRSLAARRLGISRPTLLYKLGKYGLNSPDAGEPGK